MRMRRRSGATRFPFLARGPRLTLCQSEVIDIFKRAKIRHLSAKDVHRRLLEAGTKMTLGTVYQALGEFERAGVLIRHKFRPTERSVFELLPASRHDHMVCLESGRIIEFESKEIEQLQHLVAEQHGYDLASYKLVLYVKPK